MNSRFCCTELKEAVERSCSDHPDIYECPDHLISYTPRFDEYGIIIHDGGSSSVSISFCPWCGARLPSSKRDRWFDELLAKGIDPHGQDVPEPYKTEAWYLKRSD